MIHLHNVRYTRHDASAILQHARGLTDYNDNITIRDVRVAHAHIEMDVTIPDGTLHDTVRALSDIGDMMNANRITKEVHPKEDAIRHGIECFNKERFWECHESFEGVWNECFEGEKDLLQGIILTAAALVHYQKSRDAICLSIFNRALQKLSLCSGIYHSIDVERLKERLNDMVQNKKISTFELA